MLAGRLLGRDPLRIAEHAREMANLPMAQSSTGAEYRAASAIDLTLWDIFGKSDGGLNQRPVCAPDSFIRRRPPLFKSSRME